MAETREEQYLTSIVSGESAPSPITREEQYLAYLAGSSDKYPEPITRKEALLYEICKNGGSGGSGGDSVVNISESKNPTQNMALTDFIQLGVLRFPKATTIGDYAFNICTALTSVDLPAATTIGEYAFNNCDALTSVDLPVATTIRDYAFGNCDALTSVDLPAATTIGEYAFNNCNALTTVDLPVATSIELGAFQRCTALTSVDLPVATTIGDAAFDGCAALTALILRRTDDICNVNLFAILNSGILTAEGALTGTGFIYVPTALYEAYVANFVTQATEGFGLDAATAEYIARACLRKIEDYPEITG